MQPGIHPPRENVVRLFPTKFDVRDLNEGERDVSAPNAMLTGHFAVKNIWTEIDSMWEGNFMESIGDGAFKRTFRENGSNIKVTFNHGHDVLGDQILGRIAELREDATGAYYEVELFRSVPDLLMEGLRAGQYGASFRFRVLREAINETPEVSDYNPKGLPERTIKEVDVAEFGPVSFPAYPQATAGIRSLTDEYIFDRMLDDPERVKALLGTKPSNVRVTVNGNDLRSNSYATSNTTSNITFASTASSAGAVGTLVSLPVPEASVERSEDPSSEDAAPSDPDAGSDTTSEDERREADPQTASDDDSTERTEEMDANKTLDELRDRQKDIADELARLDAEAGSGVLPAGAQQSWDNLIAERDENATQIDAKERRLAQMGVARAGQKEAGFNVSVKPSQAEVYDLSDVRTSHEPQKTLADHVSRAIERGNFVDTRDGRNKEDLQDTVADLIRKVDDPMGIVGKRIVLTSDPAYERAFWKALTHREMSIDERRAMERVQEIQDFERALATTTSGYAMPVTLDPTVLLTSNGAVNPLRQISRVVQIAGQTWNGVNSAGITASYDTEASEVSDDTPTLTQPTVTVLPARAFVPYSIESEGWAGIREEIAAEMADAKDVLEAQKFTLGTGTPEPQGFTVGATNLATTAGTAVIALSDADNLQDALPARFQPNAVWLANRKFYSKIRQLARANGYADEWSNMAVGSSGQGAPNQYADKPRYEVSDMVGTVTTSSSLIAAYGDFGKGFLIVDRIGMNVDYIQNLVGTNHRPTGQRGLFGYWNNNSVVRSIAPIRILKIL